MKRELIDVKVKEKIVDMLCLDDDEYTETDLLEGDLGFDSLDHVELIMEMEKEFEISIPDQRWEDVKTIKDVTDLVAEIVNKE